MGSKLFTSSRDIEDDITDLIVGMESIIREYNSTLHNLKQYAKPTRMEWRNVIDMAGDTVNDLVALTEDEIREIYGDDKVAHIANFISYVANNLSSVRILYEFGDDLKSALTSMSYKLREYV